MLILMIICAIIGLVIGGATGISLLGWIAGIFLFLCGLPGVLIGGFIHDEVTYAQDAADYRQMMSDFDADMRADEHELAEDIRVDRLIKTRKRPLTQIYNDKRQVHIHGGL